MIEFVKFDDVYLQLSFQWLQEDKELKWLTATGEFTQNEQTEWFNQLSEREDYIIYGIKINNEPVGAFGIKNIKDNSGEYWGYIANKKYWGLGFGIKILERAKMISEENNLKNLYLYVRNIQNLRAINLYLKFGFKFIEKTDVYVKMYLKIKDISKEASSTNDYLKNIYFTKSARSSFRRILELIGSRKLKILMPAYIGETKSEGSGVFDPVRQTNTEYDFYKINDDLSLNFSDLKIKIETGNYNCLLIIHYFGFVQKDIVKIANLCKANNVILIEDCAHSLSTECDSKPIGEFGDFSFYSLHKIIPTKNGGVLKVNNQKIGILEIEKHDQISFEDLILYTNSDIETISKKRIENYNYYLSKWVQNEIIIPLYPVLTVGTTPLNFPVFIKEGFRELIYFKLIERNVITCSLYYQLIPEIKKSIYPESYNYSNMILNFPVHQDTNFIDIEYIVNQLNEIVKDITND